MTREVVTAHPLDPIEEAASEMYERKIGCLPVLEGGELVGIVTSSDVMRTLVKLVGAHKPGSAVEVEIPDRPGSVADVTATTKDSNVNVVSIFTPPTDSVGNIGMILRLGTIDPSRVVTALKEAGYAVLWPPDRGANGT